MVNFQRACHKIKSFLILGRIPFSGKVARFPMLREKAKCLQCIFSSSCALLNCIASLVPNGSHLSLIVSMESGQYAIKVWRHWVALLISNFTDTV